MVATTVTLRKVGLVSGPRAQLTGAAVGEPPDDDPVTAGSTVNLVVIIRHGGQGCDLAMM
jgi:hypothetical protein